MVNEFNSKESTETRDTITITKDAITITKDEFFKIAKDVSTDILANDEKSIDMPPMILLTETLIHVEFVHKLKDRLFGEEV